MGTQTNAVAGLSEIATFKPDLLFLDVNMPELSGLEIVDRIPSNITVILTTAHAEYALGAFEKYIAAFLLKPFSFQKFELTVKKLMEKMSKNDS